MAHPLRVVTTLSVVLVLFVLSACREPLSDSDAREFLDRFVTSIHENTAFYKAYAKAEDRRLIDEARDRIAPEFRVLHRDYYGPGNYEYAVEFSNGARGVISIYAPRGKVESASLVLNPEQRGG